MRKNYLLPSHLYPEGYYPKVQHHLTIGRLNDPFSFLNSQVASHIGVYIFGSYIHGDCEYLALQPVFIRPRNSHFQLVAMGSATVVVGNRKALKKMQPFVDLPCGPFFLLPDFLLAPQVQKWQSSRVFHHIYLRLETEFGAQFVFPIQFSAPCPCPRWRASG